MLKGKNLWIALGVGAVAYYLWMQNKKKQTVSAPAAATNFTGDLDVPQYQNASGVPRFGKAAMYPSGQNALGRKLSGF
jgi:hypothetical protein